MMQSDNSESASSTSGLVDGRQVHLLVSFLSYEGYSMLTSEGFVDFRRPSPARFPKSDEENYADKLYVGKRAP